MSKPMMVQDHDAERISLLQKRLKLPTKIAVLRAAITLLENEAERAEKIKRWQKAATLVAKNSKQVNKDFQKSTRLKDL